MITEIKEEMVQQYPFLRFKKENNLTYTISLPLLSRVIEVLGVTAIEKNEVDLRKIYISPKIAEECQYYIAVQAAIEPDEGLVALYRMASRAELRVNPLLHDYQIEFLKGAVPIMESHPVDREEIEALGIRPVSTESATPEEHIRDTKLQRTVIPPSYERLTELFIETLDRATHRQSDEEIIKTMEHIGFAKDEILFLLQQMERKNENDL